MNDEEINIACAKGLGAVEVVGSICYFPVDMPKLFKQLDIWLSASEEKPGFAICTTPNFCNDLNACRVLETTIPIDFVPFYIGALFEVLGIHTKEFEKEARGNDFYFACVNASARQRAEAYLKGMGKWV